MGNENAPVLIRGCVWCARPVQAPVTTNHFMLFRVGTIMLIFLSMIGSILLHILLPWKVEVFEGRTLYFGVWKICKSTPHEKPYYQCFQEFYNDDEVEGWFYVWRNMLVVASCLLFLSFCYLIIVVALKRKNTKHAWILAACSCLISGGLTFSSLILFYLKFEFGFAEGARVVLDWTEETEIEEVFGYIYTLAWCIMGLMWITSYVCYYTKCLEKVYFHQQAPNKKAKVTNKLFNNNHDLKGINKH